MNARKARSVFVRQLLVGVLAAAGGVSGFALQDADRGTAVITGRAIDAATGAPIAGAMTYFSKSVAEQGRGQTGPEGRFEFAGLTEGSYFVQASLPGYAVGYYGSVRPRKSPRNNKSR